MKLAASYISNNFFFFLDEEFYFNDTVSDILVWEKNPQKPKTKPKPAIDISNRIKKLDKTELVNY